MPHHTKDKGDIGVLKAQADLASQGFMVLHPLTEHAPFDLVIYRGGLFQRVQVRYGACKPNGTVNVRLRSVWNDRHGSHVVPMKRSEVDVICVYCPDTDECYYFHPRSVQQSVSLRVRTPKNNQDKGVRLAQRYRTVPAAGDVAPFPPASPGVSQLPLWPRAEDSSLAEKS